MNKEIKKSDKQIEYENANISEARKNKLLELGYDENHPKAIKLNEMNNYFYDRLMQNYEMRLQPSEAQLKFLDIIKEQDKETYVKYWGQLESRNKTFYNAKKCINIFKRKNQSVEAELASTLKK